MNPPTEMSKQPDADGESPLSKHGSSASKSMFTREPTEFQVLWSEFVHRTKVHELLRCLELEQKKLEVLRDNLDLKVQVDLQEEFKKKEPHKKETDGKSSIEQPQPADTTKDSIDEQEQEQRQREEDDTGKSVKFKEPDSRSVVRLFENNHNINDEQFQRMLELCKDKKERQLLEKSFEEKKNRQKYLYNAKEDRRMLFNFLNSRSLQLFMLIVILLSTLVLFLLCFEDINNRYSFYLMILDSIIMAIFIVEAGLKMYIYKHDYWTRPANVLDLVIIITHFFEILVDLVTSTLAMSTDVSRSPYFKFLKSLRALRVLRAIKFLPNLQVILSTIIQSLLSITSIGALMVLFIYIFAIAGRELFREEDPKRFGNFARTCLTLFQLLTMDDWGDVWEDGDPDNRVTKFIYLFLYIIVENFVFLNLFVAVLVDNFQQTIEATSLTVDLEEEAQKWRNRLADLEADSSSSSASLHSRHNEKIQELEIDKYFRIPKESPESELISDNMKKLAAIDFHYWMWNRRMRLTSTILQSAVQEKGFPYSASNQPATLPTHSTSNNSLDKKDGKNLKDEDTVSRIFKRNENEQKITSKWDNVSVSSMGSKIEGNKKQRVQTKSKMNNEKGSAIAKGLKLYDKDRQKQRGGRQKSKERESAGKEIIFIKKPTKLVNNNQ